MLTPMQMRLQACGGGQEATISTNPNVGSSGYDPRVTPPSPPAQADVLMNVKGIYENVPQIGAATTLTARFMFEANEVIPKIESDDTFVTTGGVTFLAKMVRRRIWMGEIDGYSMELHSGGQ